MTNNEAIKTLKANYPDACYGQLREAVDTAINALEAVDGIPHFDYCEGLEKGYKKGKQEGYTEGYNSAVHDYQIGATYDPDTNTYWDVRKRK